MKLKFCTALLTAATLLASIPVMAEKAPDPAAAKRAAVAMYGKLPLSFEATESPTRFLARNGNYSLSVGALDSSVAVTDTKSGKHQMLHFSFDNANAAAPLQALEPQPGVTNYYLGADPSKWRLGVKSYGKVRAQSVYPGVDIVYYGDHRRLEFDFVVAPKADPAAIALSFSGMDKMYVDGGDLVAEISGKPVRFAKPYAYQKVNGGKKTVAADYELAANGKVHLHLGEYDRNAELIIDPVVSYATYLGGNLADLGNGIAVDSTGAAYVTGKTCSANFPVSATDKNQYGDAPAAFTGSCDAYVTKFSPDGTTFDYTTIIGGTNPDNATAIGNGIALDSANNVYITGTTNFKDIPGNVGHANGLNTYQGGDSDAFIVILSSNGALVRSSYLGGYDADAGYGIAVDTSKNVIVVGQTCSQNFPGYNAFETKIERCVAFVTKLDNVLDIGEEIQYGASAMTPLPITPTSFFSEFYGGQPVAPFPTGAWAKGTYFPLYTIIEDNEVPPMIQIVTTAGWSGPSMGTPIPPGTPTNPWNSALNGTTNDGSIVWTNLGPALVTPPTAASQANGVALDPQNDIFVAGGTNTADLGATVDSFGPFSYYHGSGAWVLKVSGVDGHRIYGTALEKNPSDATASFDTARAIAVDTSGDAYVVGTATGSVFNTANGYQPGSNATSGQSNAFLVDLKTSGYDYWYGTYLGGSGSDQGLGIAVDGSGAAYVTGSTQSPNFPTINPLTNPNSIPQPNSPITGLQGGTQNAFISKFTADGSALLFSAYLGGSGSDQGNAIALDTGSAGNMYVAGTTSSVDFEQNLDPSSYNAPQSAFGGGVSDAFVAMVAGASLPTVTVGPGNLSYGNQGVGVPSTAVLVTYTNTSTDASSTVTIKSIGFGGSNPSDFSQVFPGPAKGSTTGDCVPGVVAANTSCNIWVVFTPSGSQGRSATLTITDTYSTKPHTVSLTGTGEYPQDQFSGAGGGGVTSLTFAAASPYQTVGTSTAAQSVTLTNVGLGTLLISNISITGLNPSDFSQTNTCGAQLAYESGCTFSVVFTPSAPGLRTANLTITDNTPSSPHNIALYGTGAPIVAPTISPSSLTFVGTQTLNVASSPMTVTVTNNDPASTLSLATPSVTGPFQFASQASTCGASLTPGSSCLVAVTFTPTVAGSVTGTLSISTSAATAPVVVQLSGTGAASGSGSGGGGTGGSTVAMSLSPTTLAFGNVQVGQTSAGQMVTVTNNSSTTLTISTIADTGAYAADFTGSSTCGATLAPNASCSITAYFTPSASATETATLVVTSSASNSPQKVTMSGTGTATSVFQVAPQTAGGLQATVTQGGTATYVLSVAPNGFAGPINFSCSGANGASLPSGFNCSITPNPLTLDGTNTATATLSVKTASSSAKSRVGGRSIFLALLPFSMMGMLLVGKRRGIWLALLLVALSLLLGLMGCGASSSTTSSNNGGTPQPQSTYNLLVVATSASDPTQYQKMNLSLVVNPQ